MRILLFLPELFTLLIRKIIYPFIFFSFILFWWLTTESGLKATLWITKPFFEGTLTVKSIKGTLLSDIQINDITWSHPQFNLNAEAFSFTPHLHMILKNRLYVNKINLTHAILFIKNTTTTPTPFFHIDATSSEIEFHILGEKTLLKYINLGNMRMTMDQHTLTWKQDPPSSTNKNTLHWNFRTEMDRLSIKSHGFLELDNLDNVIGKISDLHLTFGATIKPLIFGNIELNHFNIPEIFSQQKLSGHILANINNLYAIPKLFPVIARPEGDIHADLKLEGTLKDPILALQLSLANSKFSLPKERIKIKKLNATLKGDILNTLFLSGTGHSGEGLFTFTGTASPFLKNSPNEFTLKGKNLSLHDTVNISIIASPDLKFHYTDNVLFIEGTIDIPKGVIIDREETTIAYSEDVVFKKPTAAEQSSNTSTVSPNIQLNVAEGFHYINSKLDMFLKGKLHIEKRSDGLYAGDGRLTIVEGQYRLDSGVQYIKRGRLLFVTGTLLNNPLLDIKMGPKPNTQKKEASSENTIYVYGTLKKPHVQLFETGRKTFETLSKIGLSSNTSSNISKTDAKLKNRLLASSTTPFIEKLQSNIGLDFGFETRETQESFNSPLEGQSTSVFVIGKALTDNLSVQFLQGIRKRESNARLKHALSQHLDAIVETGTDGTGADIMFSMDSD